jgi:DNA-binding CsgD family transcriptional regulator
MKSLRDVLISEALGGLGSAQTAPEFGALAEKLTEGFGMDRYIVIDVRNGTLAGLHHNAPAHLSADIENLATADSDPILGKARVSRMPFAWGRGDGGPWREAYGSLGYHSGIAGVTWDGVGSGVIALFSSEADGLPEEIIGSLLGFVVLAAVTMSTPLRRLAPRPLAECPFTARELDCLRYALAGKSSKETARSLGIGARTVNQYLERARTRLQVKTTYAAATIALRRGWIDMQEASELAGLVPAATGAR